MEEYVTLKFSANNKDWKTGSNYIKFDYDSKYFTAIGCLYTFLVWVLAYISICIGGYLCSFPLGAIANYLTHTSNHVNEVRLTLTFIGKFAWFIGVGVNLSFITNFYLRNRSKNYPIMSTKIVFNGLKTLDNFYGVGTFFRDYAYISPSNVNCVDMNYYYRGITFGGSWLMTYCLYSIIHYDKFVLKFKLKQKKYSDKKKEKKENKQEKKERTEKLLKEMLQGLEGERHED